MHDSTMPLSGLVEMLNMQINTWFGGVGVGWMNYYTFIIIAVFISGLMVGRTPEFLGKKVEAREMKIATIVALLHPFVILVGTALSSYLYTHHPDFVASEGGWLNNPSFHGLSEQLYEFTSSAANNGSGFEGLGDNTLFWNYSCWYCSYSQSFHSYHRASSYYGFAGSEEVYPRERRHIENRYSNFRRHDVCSYFYRRCFVILPGTRLEYDC